MTNIEVNKSSREATIKKTFSYIHQTINENKKDVCPKRSRWMITSSLGGSLYKIDGLMLKFEFPVVFCVPQLLRDFISMSIYQMFEIWIR